jgi:hypothetical protein
MSVQYTIEHEEQNTKGFGTKMATVSADTVEEASVPGGVPGDQKAQKVVTKYVYTKFFVRNPFFQCVCKCQ